MLEKTIEHVKKEYGYCFCVSAVIYAILMVVTIVSMFLILADLDFNKPGC
jgi:hypothetical protein